MARIRSTHPGQWSDEDFVCLTFPARLLALAVRNIADDHGIFEWKPITLKMQLFPADAVDVSELLSELQEHNVAMMFEHAGKKLGAVRNFMRWQRPKKPNYTYPVTPDVLEYVGFNSAKADTEDASEGSSSEPVPNQFPTGSEKSPQRKEVGGRRKSSDVEGFANAQPPTRRSTSKKPASEQAANLPVSPRQNLEAAEHGSAEEKFYAAVAGLQQQGVARSLVGKLVNVLGGDFEKGLAILRDTSSARKPTAYLAKIINELVDEAAAELPTDADPALPAWITEARAYGYPVEKEGEYWRFAGGLYDDGKELVGN